METLDDFSESKPLMPDNKLRIDFIVQTVILGIVLVGAAVQLFMVSFFGFYFGIGAYQLVSSFIHLRFKKHTMGRVLYWPQLAIHGLCFLSLAFLRDPIDMLLVILFTTAFSGLYYYILTIVEYVRSLK